MKKQIITSAVLLLVGLGALRAQESIIASGGDAIGSGGTIAYSVGQAVSTLAESLDGSVSSGIQQPFEIQVVTGSSISGIDLNISIYPNPTVGQVNLSVEEFENATFQLSNSQGVLLQTGKVTASTISVDLNQLPEAIYILQVLKKNSIVKTFRVVKN